MIAVCAVRWCLDAAGPHGLCPLHAQHPVKHSDEGPDKYFARLREKGVGLERRKRIRKSDATPVPLIDATTPAEPNVARPGDGGRRVWMVDPEG